MLFIKEMIRAPGVVGAIAPSGRSLSRLMVREAGVAEAERIVELGPGTGVVTREILEARKPGSKLMLLEHNSEFVAELSRRGWDARVRQGCATKLREHAASTGLDSVDSVVSGLPWALFKDEFQREILDQVRGLLGKQGRFVTFAYYGPHWTPAGQHFRRLLEERFPSVRSSRVVLRNFPPAFVYCCSNSQ